MCAQSSVIIAELGGVELTTQDCRQPGRGSGHSSNRRGTRARKALDDRRVTQEVFSSRTAQRATLSAKYFVTSEPPFGVFSFPFRGRYPARCIWRVASTPFRNGML